MQGLVSPLTSPLRSHHSQMHTICRWLSHPSPNYSPEHAYSCCFCGTSHCRPRSGRRLTNGAEGTKELQNSTKHPGSKCSCPGLERCEQAPQYLPSRGQPLFPGGPVRLTEYTKQGGKAAVEGSRTFPQFLHPPLPPRAFFS